MTGGMEIETLSPTKEIRFSGQQAGEREDGKEAGLSYAKKGIV